MVIISFTQDPRSTRLADFKRRIHQVKRRYCVDVFIPFSATELQPITQCCPMSTPFLLHLCRRHGEHCSQGAPCALHEAHVLWAITRMIHRNKSYYWLSEPCLGLFSIPKHICWYIMLLWVALKAPVNDVAKIIVKNTVILFALASISVRTAFCGIHLSLQCVDVHCTGQTALGDPGERVRGPWSTVPQLQERP